MCLFILSIASVSLAHCNISCFIVALPRLSPRVFPLGVLFTRSALGLVFGVVRIPYLQLHHILLFCRVIALIPWYSLHHISALVIYLNGYAIAIHFGTVRFPFLVSFE